MTNKAIIENKVSAVKKYLKILERYQGLSQSEIEGDIDKKGAVERYLYLAVQATIDLAEAIISFRGFRKPTTNAETFYILEEEGIIDEALRIQMTKMAGFRNIISHDYGEIDYSVVCDILKNGVKDIVKFLDVASDL